uniref:Uncharacterized protein n=1 Tax=Leersia perrieri TaxID=77586 RepID=A0A0D9X7V1_9ORYZ
MASVPQFCKSDGGAGGAKAEEPAVQRRHRRTFLQEGGRGLLLVAISFMILSCSCLVVLVGMLLRELAPEKGSHQDKVGSVLNDVGSIGNSAVICFIFGPIWVMKLREA